MTQRLGAQTVHVARLSCDADETDEACIERGRREVAGQHPPPAELVSVIMNESEVWRLRLAVDDATHDLTFESVLKVREHIASLRADGHEVQVLEQTRRASATARRSVRVRATAPVEQRHRVALRLQLTLAPADDEVSTMLRLQRAASRAALVVQSFSRRSDGGLMVLLSCERTAAER